MNEPKHLSGWSYLMDKGKNVLLLQVPRQRWRTIQSFPNLENISLDTSDFNRAIWMGMQPIQNPKIWGDEMKIECKDPSLYFKINVFTLCIYLRIW
jgi:hypothetical protein